MPENFEKKPKGNFGELMGKQGLGYLNKPDKERFAHLMDKGGLSYLYKSDPARFEALMAKLRIKTENPEKNGLFCRDSLSGQNRTGSIGI